MAISYVETASWNVAGTGGTGGAFRDLTIGTVAVGDVVLVWGVSSNYTISGTARSVATAPSATAVVTWGTAVNPAAVLNSDVDFTWRRGVVTTAGTLVARVQLRISGSEVMGAGAWLIPAAEVGAAEGALGSSFAGVGTNIVSRTVPTANSRVWYMMGDWNAVVTATTTGNPGTNVTYGTRVQVAGQHSVWGSMWESQASGTRNYGMAGSAGLDATGFVYYMEPAPAGGTPGTFDTLTGEATAEGGSASMTGEGVFDTVTGEATADGGAATMSGAAVFSTLTGSATADGGTASMTGGAVFTAGTGAATADGGAVTMSGAAEFTTAAGTALAEGGAASFVVTTGASFDTLTGSAVADGGAVTMTGAAVFSTLTGAATAEGGAASFVPGAASTFVALTGEAIADGGVVTMSGGAVFSTLGGAATAAGGAATMTGAATFATLEGVATADGELVTMTGGAVFSTLVGAALAEGGAASFELVGAAPPIPRSRRLVGAARPFDLVGASRSVTLRAAARPHGLETP